MNKMQQQVLEFHQKLGVTVGETPAIRDLQLRKDLITEEVNETFKAMEEGDLVETIDGLCDILYVVFGAAVTCGIDLEPFFDEVHRSNMEKIGGPVREDGKKMKPLGWKPPQIKELLDKVYS